MTSSQNPPGGVRRCLARRAGNRPAEAHVSLVREGVPVLTVSWLVALPSVDGMQYVYRVYAPEDALPADLFWAAWHCHDEGPHPRAWDVFDAAVIRRLH